MHHKHRIVECTLETLDGGLNIEIRLTETKSPCRDAKIFNISQLRHYPHLEDIGIVVAAHDESLLGLNALFGVENGDMLTSEECVLGAAFRDPVAVRCPLLWYMQGGRCAEDILTNAVVIFKQVSAISDVEYCLGIERVSVEPRHCKCVTEERDRLATQTMKESVVQLNDGTYQICLSWRKSLPHPAEAIPEQTSRMGSLLESDGRSTQPWSWSFCADFRN